MHGCVVDETALSARLDEVGRWLLNRDFSTAYLMITRLGLPTFANVGTACVGVSGDRILFQFDPAFWNSLRLAGLVGVLAHEALHVLLRHVAGPCEQDPVRVRCWNLACDAVVNDRLIHDYPEIRLPNGAITGRLLVGHDCHEQTAEGVMGELLKRIQQDPTVAAALVELQTLDCHDGWSENSAGQGELPTELEQGIAKIVQVTGWHDRSAARAWGLRPGAEMRDLHLRATPVDPMTLLQAIVARSTRPVAQWVPPNPKLLSVYPRVLLPRWDDDGNARLLFAIDASGSIDDEWLSVFAAVPRAIRTKARIEIVSFDTEVYPFDPLATGMHGGGGTRFQAIADYVAALPRYPDGIIVLTDGHAERPSIRHPDRWLWLLTVDGAEDAIRGIGRIIRVRLR
jgi:hypothetical protein